MIHMRRAGHPPKPPNDIVWMPQYAQHLAHQTVTAVAQLHERGDHRVVGADDAELEAVRGDTWRLLVALLALAVDNVAVALHDAGCAAAYHVRHAHHVVVDVVHLEEEGHVLAVGASAGRRC